MKILLETESLDVSQAEALEEESRESKIDQLPDWRSLKDLEELFNKEVWAKCRQRAHNLLKAFADTMTRPALKNHLELLRQGAEEFKIGDL